MLISSEVMKTVVGVSATVCAFALFAYILVLFP